MRLLASAGLALALSLFAPPAQDASFILQAARAAMGGDAALNAVTSLRMNGSWSTYLRPITLSRSLEVSYQAPDKFVRVGRRTSTFGPPGAMGQTFSITEYSGFNGDQPILATVAPDAPIPVVIPAPEPRTPDEIAAAAERRMRSVRTVYASMLLPLFASSLPAMPFTFTAEPQITFEGGVVDVVSARGTHGEWKLLVDTRSRLPIGLKWLQEPIVTMSTSSTVVTNSRGGIVSQSPRAPLPPPPTGLSKVEWTMTLSDFKKVDGLLWPHRLTTTVGDAKHEEIRINRIRINLAIDPKTFNVRK